jgi:hypothetical protein
MTDLDALRRELIRELCRLALSQAAGDWERVLELQRLIRRIKAERVACAA